MSAQACNWIDAVLANRPAHFSQRASKLTRKLAKGSVGGEVYALSEMVDRINLIRDFYEPFQGLAPGAPGLGDCWSLFTHSRTEKSSA